MSEYPMNVLVSMTKLDSNKPVLVRTMLPLTSVCRISARGSIASMPEVLSSRCKAGGTSQLMLVSLPLLHAIINGLQPLWNRRVAVCEC